ncbi:MAG: FHA domain-containing serine/threonine-protein kinase [Anaerolineae bacterium]|nr:FHA domain-containing serine/threonine-protein kinase [Anaerolineae bacterium]
MEDLLGKTFGGYELKEIVGAGGMASIYKGYDEKLSRWVAIKVVTIQASSGGEEKTMLARFRLEAQAIAALRHRNILTIYSYGEEDGWAYIVMEFVPGGSLKDRMDKKKVFTWQEALTIIIPVSQALAFAHGRQIIHRDIKPANILMPQDDWPLLADFGLAKMQQNSGGSKPNLTMPGQVLGTMAYAAPEQIQEGEIDHRVDIYSLGIVLYELLTGQLPFKGATAFDFLMARLTDPPVPLLEANPDVPPAFGPILEQALAPDPEARFQLMEDFSQALMQTRYELSQSIVTPAPGAYANLNKNKAMSKVRLRVMPGGQEILASSESELIIGRAYKSMAPDIDLAPYGGSKAGVSRRHGRIVRGGDRGWMAEDLGSTNGTFVNGVRLPPNKPVALTNGDLIRCGQIELEFSEV